MSNELAANWAGALASIVASRLKETAEARSESEIAALLSCHYFPTLSVGELAEVLGLTASGAVRLLDRLEDQRLIRRRAGEGRTVIVESTARGRRVAEDLQRRRLTAIDDLLSVLSTEERDEFASLVATILRGAGLGASRARHVCRLCDHISCDGTRCPIGSTLRLAGERVPRARAPA
ncbi:MAG TPA: MarR family transcriptional regulator [Solirubrobacteraceae bacterium]